MSEPNIKQTIADANAALSSFNDVMKKVNEGEGSVGMLLHNDSLYYNLENASNNLDKLLLDLNENPGRYIHFLVFGGREKKKK